MAERQESTKVIERLETKQGAKGPYERLHYADGKGSNLFDDDLVSIARANTGQPVTVGYIKEGEFWNVEYIKGKSESAPAGPSEPNDYEHNKNKGFALSYGKDIAVALINAGAIKPDEKAADRAYQVATELGRQFLSYLEGKQPTAEDISLGDDIPF